MANILIAEDEAAMVELNRQVLSQVTGELGALEVINSGSCFELPDETLEDISKILKEKDIRKLFLNLTGCIGGVLTRCAGEWAFPWCLRSGWRLLTGISGRES